jgi:hypothetical protein
VHLAGRDGRTPAEVVDARLAAAPALRAGPQLLKELIRNA